MKREYPPLYGQSLLEACRLGEESAFHQSFRLNVSCARAIEQAIRDYADEDDPKGFLFDGCAQSVLKEYGFQRVQYVLANSLQNTGVQHLHNGEILEWGRSIPVHSNDGYSRYFEVDTAAALLDEFVAQFRQSAQSLGLSSPEQADIPAQGNMEMR